MEKFDMSYIEHSRFFRPPHHDQDSRPQPVPPPSAAETEEEEEVQPATRDSAPETCNSGSVRRPGGQPGNQNARRHGLYAGGMTKKERRLYEQAKEMGGNAAEKALLRLKLAGYMEKHPDDLVILAKIVKALEIKS